MVNNQVFQKIDQMVHVDYGDVLACFSSCDEQLNDFLSFINSLHRNIILTLAENG